MSWPQGGGVNAFVPDDRLDCLHIKLPYPTIDNLVTQISKIGPHALLYKVDLQRAYGGHSGRVVTLSPPTSEAGV